MSKITVLCHWLLLNNAHQQPGCLQAVKQPHQVAIAHLLVVIAHLLCSHCIPQQNVGVLKVGKCCHGIYIPIREGRIRARPLAHGVEVGESSKSLDLEG